MEVGKVGLASDPTGLGIELIDLELETPGLGIPVEELESASTFLGFLDTGFALLWVFTCFAR